MEPIAGLQNIPMKVGIKDDLKTSDSQLYIFQLLSMSPRHTFRPCSTTHTQAQLNIKDYAMKWIHRIQCSKSLEDGQ